MGKPLHLCRRGQIWYWRRRVAGFSTENAVIQLSLRTAIRSEACILSNKLTAESDRMFDAMSRNLQTQDDARKWLAHIIADELKRIRRVLQITQMDPQGSAEADARADWATAMAWKLMAEFGPRGCLEQKVIDRLVVAGATDADLAALETTLSMLAGDMQSEARMRRIAAGFRSLTGQERRPDSVTLLHLRRLLIEGRAAAHAQRDSLAEVEAGIAGDLAREIAAEMSASERQGRSGMGELLPVPVLVPVAAAASAHPSMVGTAGEEAASVAPSGDEDPLFDPSILATTGRLNSERYETRRQERRHLVEADGGPSPVPGTMEKLRLGTARLFILATGITDLRDVRPGHLSVFRDTMQRIPTSWGKSRADADRTIEEALARAERLPPEKTGFAVPTINRHLDMLALIFGRADNDGIRMDPKCQPKKLKLREKTRARDKRPGFGEEDLKRLFRHCVWTGCQGARNRNSPGNRQIRDGLWWVPLIAAYSGARREEIAGLMCADIREEDGIIWFDIRDNANRGVKTLAGERRIPVHDRLIALGFPDYVARMRRRGESDLFPELRPKSHVKGSGTKFGAALYDRFSTALELVFGGNPRGFVTHSFRHYVNDRLSRVPAIPKLVRIELIGHEGEDTNERIYVEPSPLRELQAAINALPVVEDLPAMR